MIAKQARLADRHHKTGEGMIEDFQHVCITCRDLGRSVRFYERLGLQVIRPVSELEEEAIARAFQTARGHIKVLHLAPPEASSKMFIDLVQWLEPSSTGEAYPAANHVGISRLAFRVPNIDSTAAALRERGMTFLTQEPQSIGSIRTIVATDPDGVFIQLLEWL
jgi:catechol 2,3-dioxygenase-like lactoylglutathione lyase family enzyme